MPRALKDPGQLTAQQFREALLRLRPRLTDHQLTMLRAHYSAPQHTLSATQMAHALGYHSYAAANLHYGRLASILCEELGYPDDSIPLFLLVSFTEPFAEENPHWLWVMRPQVVQALEQLGWVVGAEAVMPLAEVESLPERITATVSRIIRDTDAARSLKARYHHRCQVCGLQIEAAPGRYYIEVHHVRPLGAGHDGKDEHSNMLVLCPNHHAMFDLMIPRFLSSERIAIGGEEFRLESQHTLSPDVISYYNDLHERRAP